MRSPSPSAKKKFYEYLGKQPCLVCGCYGVQIAHIRGFASAKTGDFLPRRQGMAELAAIPLCPEHHTDSFESIHNLGELQFFDQLGKPSGWVYAYLARSIAEALA